MPAGTDRDRGDGSGAGALPGERLALHALAWLVVGNGVGLLLATLLLAPRAGDLLGPLTYGRWMPVHWNAQLYGWLALPLVGMLLRLYGPPGRPAGGTVPATPSRIGRIGWSGVPAVWSAVLAAGCVSWLAGQTTGKPFLEWTGIARWSLIATLVFLEGVLVAAWIRHWLRRPRGDAGDRSRTGGGRWARGALLGVLATVPVGMAVATSPRIYPPINPDSGGPTGASLLGSTLGIVWLFVLLPVLLDLPARSPGSSWNRPAALGIGALAAVHTGAWLALELLQGGDRSHHDAAQVIALASLLPWPVLLAAHLRRFRTPDGAGRWLGALGVWGALLTGTAFVTFLPGVLERWKFTNALVAHAHLAMAGMVTSLAALLLVALTRHTRLAGVLAAPGPFVAWHFGCLLYVVSMLLLGVLEGIDPGLVIRGAPVSTGLYAFRWVAGAMMLGTSAVWLVRSRRRLVDDAARPPGQLVGAAAEASPPTAEAA